MCVCACLSGGGGGGLSHVSVCVGPPTRDQSPAAPSTSLQAIEIAFSVCVCVYLG